MPTPDVVAELVRSNPSERDQMLGLLQQTLGNSFVRRVIAAQGASITADPTSVVAAGSEGNLFVDATGVHATGSITKPAMIASGAANAGLAAPGGIAADTSGNFRTPNGISGNGTITDANGQVSGAGSVTYTGKDGTVTGDIQGGPTGITADASGNFKTGGLSGNGTFTDANGQVSGTGSVTYTGKDGTITGDIQGGPTGITADASGNFKTGGLSGNGTITDANGQVSGAGSVTYTGKDGTVTGDIQGGPTGITA
ncbi:MAG TPA: hypothetical protein VHN14_02775, partial [Kofleriaceae bacterium]|nr:hypothetical protein [Kofleriaceae bacterium]